ncbi:MAG: fimbria/pilus outer membrane usher protein [Pararobbsia sp.]
MAPEPASRGEGSSARAFSSRIRGTYLTTLPAARATLSMETTLRLGAGALDLRERLASERLVKSRSARGGSYANRRPASDPSPHDGAAAAFEQDISRRRATNPALHPATPVEGTLRTCLAQTLHRRLSWHACAAWRSITAAGAGRGTRGGVDYQFGAGTSLGPASLSLSLAHSREWRRSAAQWQVSLDLAVRLGQTTAPLFSTQTEFDSMQQRSRRFALSGSVPGEGELDYSLDAGCTGMGSSGDFASAVAEAFTRTLPETLRCTDQWQASLAYAGRRGIVRSSLSHTGSLSLSTSGSVVAHRGGLTLGPALGDTIALIDTKQGAGLRIAGMPHSEVNRYGYAIVPSLMPYRLNDIEIDPSRIPGAVHLKSSSHPVAPVAGAVVRVVLAATRIDTRRLRITMTDGRSPPFGAAVRNAQGERIGSIGQGGRLTVSKATTGTLHVELAGRRSATRAENDAAARKAACAASDPASCETADQSTDSAILEATCPTSSVSCKPAGLSTRPAVRGATESAPRASCRIELPLESDTGSRSSPVSSPAEPLRLECR